MNIFAKSRFNTSSHPSSKFMHFIQVSIILQYFFYFTLFSVLFPNELNNFFLWKRMRQPKALLNYFIMNYNIIDFSYCHKLFCFDIKTNWIIIHSSSPLISSTSWSQNFEHENRLLEKMNRYQTVRWRQPESHYKISIYMLITCL